MRTSLIVLGFLIFALCALNTADAVHPDARSRAASPPDFQQATSEPATGKTAPSEPTFPSHEDTMANKSLWKRFINRLKRYYAESRRRFDSWKQRRRSSRSGIRESVADACRCVKTTVVGVCENAKKRCVQAVRRCLWNRISCREGDFGDEDLTPEEEKKIWQGLRPGQKRIPEYMGKYFPKEYMDATGDVQQEYAAVPTEQDSPSSQLHMRHRTIRTMDQRDHLKNIGESLKGDSTAIAQTLVENFGDAALYMAIYYRIDDTSVYQEIVDQQPDCFFNTDDEASIVEAARLDLPNAVLFLWEKFSAAVKDKVYREAKARRSDKVVELFENPESKLKVSIV
jgi:hypothetical protein